MELFTQAELLPWALFARVGDVIPGGISSSVRARHSAAGTPLSRLIGRRGTPGVRRSLCGLSSSVSSVPDILGVGYCEPVRSSDSRVSWA